MNDKAVADRNIAYAHIGHVMTGWTDTPTFGCSCMVNLY